MTRLLATLMLLILAGSATAQELDAFTGQWVGHGYDCYDGDGVVVLRDERVEIRRDGERLVATKLEGDACVGAGEPTWTAEIKGGVVETGIAYPAASHLGAPDGARIWVDGAVIFTKHGEILWTADGSPRPEPVVFRRPDDDRV